MAKPRFRKTDKDSFFGNFIFDRVVPPDHFFRQLDRLIAWEEISRKLARYYQGEASYGAVPYEPAMLFKMLLVAYIYNFSERQVEELANDSLAVKCFLGLAVDEKAPDHSSLTVFRERLLRGGGTGVYEELFQGILREAQIQGIELGKVQVVDSTHTIADVDVGEEDKRRGAGEGPRDGEARWGAKGREVRVVDGKKTRRTKFFYGYKAHMSLNAETGLITAVEHTQAM
jgi:IS5 family transposase